MLSYIYFENLYTNFTPTNWDKIGILEICSKTNTDSIGSGLILLTDLNWYMETIKKSVGARNNGSVTELLKKAIINKWN